MTQKGADGLLKAAAHRGYGAVLGLHALVSAPISGGHGAVRVFYGGARSGDVGGPLVKVQRLRARFPESWWRYTLVYVLSNAAYLPDVALRLLRRRGVPLVHNQNGVFYPAWYAGDCERRNRRMARTYLQGDYVFWQSGFCRRCADRFLGEREGPGEILFNAVDTARFVPGRPANDRFTFLVTGKIDDHMVYRLTGSIAGLAAARMGGLDAALRIAGFVSPRAAAAARAQAEALGVGAHVSLTGSYTQAEAPAIYAAADAYVMTKHNDPCPNTVLEALACGLPVVHSASGGVPELVGDAGIGLPMPESFDAVQSPAAEPLGEAMVEVAAQRERLSVAARARAERMFDIRHWLERHEAVFRALVR